MKNYPKSDSKLFVYIYLCKFDFLIRGGFFGGFLQSDSSDFFSAQNSLVVKNKFGYIPRIDIKNFDQDNLQLVFLDILQKARQENLSYLKFDFDLYPESDGQTGSQINLFLQRLNSLGFRLQKSPAIQFLKSYQLDLVQKKLIQIEPGGGLEKGLENSSENKSEDDFENNLDANLGANLVSDSGSALIGNFGGGSGSGLESSQDSVHYVKKEETFYKVDFGLDDLDRFYLENKEFWKSCNEKVNRYTKKILKTAKSGEILILSQKNQELWESFYDLHSQTTQRQNFHTQPKAYLEELFWQKLSLVYTIFLKNNGVWEPASTFLGIISPDNQSLTYLIGGNTEFGMTSRVQYLTQLLAIKFCKDNHIPLYDMGGYEQNSGYGQFKESYKGQVAKGEGVYTIKLKPFSLDLILEKLKKAIK